METDSLNTWQQDSVVISWEDAVAGTPQRRSSWKEAHVEKDAIKTQLQPEGGRCKSWVGGAPKRHAVGLSQAGEFDSTNAMYVPRSESESEDYDMCMASDDEG